MRYVCYTFYDSSNNNKILGEGWSIIGEIIINASLWSYEGVDAVHIVLLSLLFLVVIWHWVFGIWSYSATNAHVNFLWIYPKSLEFIYFFWEFFVSDLEHST
jgi:hypothetical protein